MARPVLKPDETFEVLNRPRAWLGMALLSFGCVLVVGVIVVGLWRVDPGILREPWVRLVVSGFVLAAVAFAWAARRLKSHSYVSLSADALGVWAGRFGRRQTWGRMRAIYLRRAKGDLIGPERFLAFEEAGARGWVDRALSVRMIDLWGVAMDKDAIVAGLSAAAKAGGYRLEEVEAGRRWQVVKPGDTVPQPVRDDTVDIRG